MNLRATLVSFLLLTIVVPALAASPTLDEIKSAIGEMLKSAGILEPPDIRTRMGCLPGFHNNDEPAPQEERWVCAIEHRTTDKTEVIVGTYEFVLSKSKWAMTQNRLPKAACPSTEVAEAILRKMRSDDRMKVLKEKSDDKGIFSDNRGHEREGPLRLMCRYTIETGRGARWYLITYVWHDGTNYTIDPDLEAWPD